MKRMLTLFAALLAIPLGNLQGDDVIGEKPNVVLFLVDDMGWMDCGVYGSTYYETPNIDRFADRAMRFTNAYAQPLCSPTRASILSGQHSSRHGITSATGHLPPQEANHRYFPETAPPNAAMIVPESKHYLDPSQITLAETLRASGYRTAHIGKWHLGTTVPHWPEQQGFDVAFHCHPDPGPPGGYFSPYGVKPEGIPGGNNKVGTITDGLPGEYIVDRQAVEALKFLQDNQDRPFFLNLWCYGVHGPWGHKEEYTREFAGKKDPSGRQGNPIMASMLRSVDECFGRILDELERLGIADNTIVIFYSDNGGNKHSNTNAGGPKSANADWQKWAGLQPPTNNAPLRDGKGTLYEGGTRVPLMWAWAGRIQPGSTSDAVVGPIDLYPTVLDLLAIAKPKEQVIDGISYAAVLKGEGSLSRNGYFNYFPHAGANRAGGVWVRSGEYKLIRWFGNPDTYELFDLGEDIGEANDLAAKMPTKVKELDAMIDRFLKDTGALFPKPNPAYKPTAAKPTALNADPLLGWKERGCAATITDGILTIKGTGKPGTAFLGHGTGRTNAPATVLLRVRSEVGGAGKIDCMPMGATDSSQVISTPFEVQAGEWQEIQVELKHRGPIGTLRLYLPVATHPIEVDRIDLQPAKGPTQSWGF